MTNGDYEDDGTISVTITDPSLNCTATVDNDAHKVTVTHDDDSTLTNEFSIDEDVTLTIE